MGKDFLIHKMLLLSADHLLLVFFLGTFVGNLGHELEVNIVQQSKKEVTPGILSIKQQSSCQFTKHIWSVKSRFGTFTLLSEDSCMIHPSSALYLSHLVF